MKNLFIISILLILASAYTSAHAEEEDYDEDFIPLVENPQLKINLYEGYYWACIDGE